MNRPLHIFNCDNDLALANFSPGFTPPAHIRQMMDELSSLPLAWGGMDPMGEDGVSVWGWSPAVCHRLRQLGVPESSLPSHSQLIEIRRLSSRERAVELLSAMRQEGVCAPFQSVFCIDEAQVEEALARWPRTILKAPWSSSGKGIRFGQGGREDTLRGWYRRILQQQGAVVVEPLYDKLHDLAMEFWSDGGGRVCYQGLSFFDTHPNGAYRGNLLLPELEKEAWLHRFVSPQYVLAVRQWLELRLGQMIGTAYRGYLGVDMMLVSSSETGDSVLLHPMVELNLRMTMGMASILLQRGEMEDYRGVFRLDFFPNPADLQADNAVRRSTHPGFRILASGDHYRAYIEQI